MCNNIYQVTLDSNLDPYKLNEMKVAVWSDSEFLVFIELSTQAGSHVDR